jgi:outer membrane protein OmpA-like peptidoglycan-associated protein
MKRNIAFKKGSRRAWLPYSLVLAGLFLGIWAGSSILSPLKAQAPQYTQPAWWVGVAGAGNINFYRGSTQRLTTDIIAPVAFHQGTGLGLYLAPLLEFHRSTSNWGLMFQAGYDSRKGTFQTQYSPCNCPRDLSTRLAYVTFEPSLRFAPFKSHFYLFGGPRVAYNIGKSFTYQQGTNPDYPEQTPVPDIKGELSQVNQVLVSSQIGAGYDIRLTEKGQKTQLMLSPFAAFQPYFGQEPRAIETWTVTTVRVGLALKLGSGKLIPATEVARPPSPRPVLEEEPTFKFTVHAPKNIPVKRKVREVFPLRNYIFFDLESSSIPDRYVLLNKDQVKEFKEEQVELYTPKNLSGRSGRQLVVYYNILNILGDRMVRNPGTTITLVGSSGKNSDDGVAMAVSVKEYLVDLWKIDPARISVEGQTHPNIASEGQGVGDDSALLREGNRRVSIESSSPILLMQFNNDPKSPFKSIEVIADQDAPLESYVSLDVEGARKAFSTWSVEIKDENGYVQNFGPYAQERVMISGKSILGTRPEGDYTVTMTGTTRSGKTYKEVRRTHMVLWTPPVNQEVMRFSVIYEFDESEAISLYEKYLTEVVLPKIPKGGLVILHGHTDVIGEDVHNQELSLARANNVKDILMQGLARAGRNDVTFEVYGFGEDANFSPFENKYPEERSYNRTVVIDIVPGN